nr:7999_t:CDS:2 [Entrophospora candida]
MASRENQPLNNYSGGISINNSYFNNKILLEKEEIIKFIDDTQLNNPLYLESLKSLRKLENGGFGHEDMGNLYVTFQNDKYYRTTRYKGWQNLFCLMLYAIEKNLNKSHENLSIIDFLSGSGTLSKRLKILWKQEQNLPTVLGMDISEKMFQLARENGETVFWGSCRNHCFKKHIADTVIASYGVHHIPPQERKIFITSAYNILKENGVCLIHDFLEGHPSTRWYSEIIHKYRTYGHDCKHFTEEDMFSLFSEDFSTSEVHKLLPKSVTFEQIFHYKDVSYWKDVEEIFTPYFRVSQSDIKRIDYFVKETKNYEDILHPIEVPIFEELTIYSLSNQKIPDQATLCLVAPRMAIVGIGYKGKLH